MLLLYHHCVSLLRVSQFFFLIFVSSQSVGLSCLIFGMANLYHSGRHSFLLSKRLMIFLIEHTKNNITSHHITSLSLSLSLSLSFVLFYRPSLHPKFNTAFAAFVSTMTINSQFDVVASSASVLDEADRPKTRKVRMATILRFIRYARIVSYRILS